MIYIYINIFLSYAHQKAMSFSPPPATVFRQRAEHLGLNSAMIFTFNFMAIVPLASAAAANVAFGCLDLRSGSGFSCYI